VVALFRRRGIDVDPERLEDRVAAELSRRKSDDAQHIQKVRAAATAAKRAKRACQLAEGDWRREPNSDTLAETLAAQRARSEAEQALREACQFDDDLASAVMRQVGR
jgi:hypothetical protein